MSKRGCRLVGKIVIAPGRLPCHFSWAAAEGREGREEGKRMMRRVRRAQVRLCRQMRMVVGAALIGRMRHGRRYGPDTLGYARDVVRKEVPGKRDAGRGRRGMD